MMGDSNVTADATQDTSSYTITTSPADIITTLFVSQTTLSRQTLSESTTMSGNDCATTTATAEAYDENSSYYYYEYDYGDEYMYPGYSFERPVYLYIWEILVVFVFFVNIVVISVLLRRKMRNATNMILAAIAISDSLTGLVTLPTYIMVYQNYDPLMHHNDYPDPNVNQSYLDYTRYDYLHGNGNIPQQVSNNCSNIVNVSNSLADMPAYQDYGHATQAPVDGYILTKSLCRGFMISKYFLSKSFHTVSIFLTLFLGVQRYVSVAFPFRSQSIFSVRNTIICCLLIFGLSPILHSYHLNSEKASNGLCQWELAEVGCGSGCFYLWFAFFVRHLIPCVALLVFTGLFIRQLRIGEKNLRRMDSNASQLSRRVEENRRISIVVTAIVIVFLVPEIPYGVFLFNNAIEKTMNNGRDINLETNRAIHMCYEILLVLSFHANFYIYTFLNRRFRKCLYRTFIKPVQRYVGDARRLSVSRTSSMSHKTTTTRKTDFSSKSGHELYAIHRGSTDKSATLETKFMESFSADITQSSHPDCHELEALNAKV